MSGRGMRYLSLAIVALLLLSVGTVLAAERLGGKVRSGEVVHVASGETVHGDLYAAGERVTIDGTVEGDLIVGAGTLELNGTVLGDLVVGSGDARISGLVGGDARIGAGQLAVSGTIREDLVAFAGQINVTGEVGEDLLFFAGDVAMDGRVAGDVLGSAGRYDRRGAVGGSEEVTLGRAFEEPGVPAVRDRVGDTIRTFVTVAVLAALLMWLYPRAIVEPAQTLRRRPLASLGVGVLAIIGFIVGIVVLLVISVLFAVALGVAGLGPLAGLVAVAGVLAVVVGVFLFVVAATFIVQSVVGLALARLAFRDEPPTRWITLGLALGGAALVVLVSALPGIGGLAGLLVVLFGLGSMAVAAWTARRPPVAATPGPPPAA